MIEKTEKKYSADEMLQSHQAGFKEGFDHREPSAPTLNMIEKITEKLDSISNDSIEIKTDLKYVKGEINNFDNKYAKKELTENKIETLNIRVDKHDDNLKWVVRSIIGIVISAIMGLIIISK